MFGTEALVGLDLGQQNDYSVLSVLSISIDNKSNLNYVLNYIRKYKLRTDYTTVVRDVCECMESDRLKGQSALIVDYSGVGRPLIDLLRQQGLSPVGITITGGKNSRWIDNSSANVAKSDIVSTLQIVSQNNRLSVPMNLPERRDLEKELLNFKARISASGVSTFEGRGTGIHDDIVMSIGIAMWYGEFVNKKGKNMRIIGGN